MSESVHEGLDMAAETAGAERYSMGKGDGGLLALSFLSSLCFFFGHWNFRGFYYGPGIGLTVTHWVLTVYVMLLGFRRHTLHKSAGGIFLLALSLLLSASYGIFANVTLRLLNLPVLFLLTGLTLSALAGHTSDPLSAQGLWEGLRRCGCGLFRWWAPPFRFFSGRGDKGAAGTS